MPPLLKKEETSGLNSKTTSNEGLHSCRKIVSQIAKMEAGPLIATNLQTLLSFTKPLLCLRFS